MAGMSPELASAIIASSQRLGVDPLHIATVISYETGGKFDPNLWGGKNNNHLGYIQFGGPEREKYGVKEGQTPAEQMAAVESYLRDRGVKPGMGMMDIYSTINAGSPGLYNRSDAGNGGAPGTVADKVNSQMASHRENAVRLLGAGPVGALDAAAAPAPQPGPPTVLPSSPDAAPQGPPLPASNALANLGAALGGDKPGAAPAQPTAPDFLPAQQIQMAQPQYGQSQQIAAALAKAYGIGG